MLALSATGVLLAACGQPPPADTPTIPNTNTPPPPTLTSTATASATPLPSVTPSPVAVTPVWSDLPVLPEVVDDQLEETELGISYASPVEIEDAEVFYQQEMEAGGWQLIQREYNEESLFGGPAIILVFQRNHETAVIMLIYSTNENYTMVFLSGKVP